MANECRRRRLIVEVDGMQHGFDGHCERDGARDRMLNELGYRVLRFGNPEIDQNMEGFLEAIRLALIADVNELQNSMQSLLNLTPPRPPR
jgi:very-short-patch-repair endonuclease